MKSADRDMIREFLKNTSFQEVSRSKNTRQISDIILSESTSNTTSAKDSHVSERDIVKNFLRNIMGE
jgi:hypothetical protein